MTSNFSISKSDFSFSINDKDSLNKIKVSNSVSRGKYTKTV